MKKLECYTTAEFLQSLQYINKNHPDNGYFVLDQTRIFNHKYKDSMIKLTVEFEEPPKKATITEKDLESKFKDILPVNNAEEFAQKLKSLLFKDGE